ncbi:hypothetical protein FRB95_014631 [Tulasnella sp. JGI-2019a]|nr:hypothetical protein FRB95_014631 [Tulasnella sp. JGI-2019a]
MPIDDDIPMLEEEVDYSCLVNVSLLICERNQTDDAVRVLASGTAEVHCGIRTSGISSETRFEETSAQSRWISNLFMFRKNVSFLSMATPKSVNDLPVEILGMVFFESLKVEPDQKLRRQYPEWLAHVCRSWKELMEGYPELRSCIDAVIRNRDIMEVQTISNRIRKAKGSLLAIRIHWSWGFNTIDHVLTLYGLIKDHRWRALSIFDPEYLSPFEIIWSIILKCASCQPFT